MSALHIDGNHSYGVRVHRLVLHFSSKITTDCTLVSRHVRPITLQPRRPSPSPRSPVRPSDRPSFSRSRCARAAHNTATTVGDDSFSFPPHPPPRDFSPRLPRSWREQHHRHPPLPVNTCDRSATVVERIPRIRVNARQNARGSLCVCVCSPVSSRTCAQPRTLRFDAFRISAAGGNRRRPNHIAPRHPPPPSLAGESTAIIDPDKSRIIED